MRLMEGTRLSPLTHIGSTCSQGRSTWFEAAAKCKLLQSDPPFLSTMKGIKNKGEGLDETIYELNDQIISLLELYQIFY